MSALVQKGLSAQIRAAVVRDVPRTNAQVMWTRKVLRQKNIGTLKKPCNKVSKTESAKAFSVFYQE